MGTQINAVKILKSVLILILGFGVYFTEHSLRTKVTAGRKEARRSLSKQNDDSPTSDELAEFLSKQPKTETQAVAEKIQSLDKLPEYIIEVSPQAILYKQKSQEREEFERQFLEVNVTRWQYPDFVRVPLSSLGVVFYNGQRFYRQGKVNPPEYAKNVTDADTRSASGVECKRKNEGGDGKGKIEDTGMLTPRSGSGPQQPSVPVGCCNGVPYNSSKRCCCRRASFDKDTKFCCAIDGCGDFKIMNRDSPNAIQQCRELDGIVVQEYGYHENIPNFPNFLSQRDPPRRS